MRYSQILFLFFLIGCYTERNATKDLEKAQIKYPEIVAKKTTQWYPCLQIQTKSDSSFYKKWIKAIDSLNKYYLNYKPDTLIVVDTILKIDSANCTQLYKNNITLSNRLNRANVMISVLNDKIREVPVIHDTIIKIDSAALKVYGNRIEVLSAEKDKLYKKYVNVLWWVISLLIPLIISIIINIIKFRR